MLKKLLKYEFAATARYILPLIVLLFVMSAAAGLCIRGLGAERTGRVAVAVSAIFVVLFFLAVIALAVVTALHLWKRNVLLSIGAGTVVYMLLVQLVFA